MFSSFLKTARGPRPTATSREDATASTPKYIPPSRPEYVKEFIKKMQTPSADDLVERYKAHSKNRNTLGQQKVSIDAEITTVRLKIEQNQLVINRWRNGFVCIVLQGA